MPTVLNERQARALLIVRDHGPIRAGEFAKMYFPDHPGWAKAIDAGYGNMRVGGGMAICAGGFLAKLVNKCLIEKEDGYFTITPDGRAAIRLWQQLEKRSKREARHGS